MQLKFLSQHCKRGGGKTDLQKRKKSKKSHYFSHLIAEEFGMVSEEKLKSEARNTVYLGIEEIGQQLVR